MCLYPFVEEFEGGGEVGFLVFVLLLVDGVLEHEAGDVIAFYLSHNFEKQFGTAKSAVLCFREFLGSEALEAFQ